MQANSLGKGDFMLEFEVNGQRLRLKGNLYVVAESIDYLKARFSFSADWDGAAKTAIFKTADRKGVYNVILDENGICTVPSEVIHAPRFYVSVFGGSRITANEVEVQCNVSGYAEGSAPDTPTPEIYEQILAEINKKVSKVDGMGLSENSYTTEEKTKLSGIAKGAEVNVQSDWSQTNADADDYIKNKPTKLSQFENDSGYATSADLSGLSSGLSQGITNVSNALSNHQSATVLPHADGSVTTAKLAAGAVTKEKIAKGVIPTSLPASDVYDWAKQSEKPKYTAAEVDALPSNTVIPSYSVATQSKDGLMSSADKKKLDGLSESGGGGITEETDPTVPSWAKQPEKPTYTAAEVGADSDGSAASALSDAKTYIDEKVKTNVPENALFTDTVYDDTELVRKNKLLEAVASEQYDVVTHVGDKGIYSSFPNEFIIYNNPNTFDGADDVSKLYYDDYSYWVFSEPLKAGYAYYVKVISEPETTVDAWNNGIIQVLHSLQNIKANIERDVTILNDHVAGHTVEIADTKAALAEVSAAVGDISAILGYDDDDIVGLQVDYANCIFTRLAGAKNLTAGADFDKYTMFGGRRRCNVADDGTINAYYGDEGYTEDGSNGQVMVYQPVFYYHVVPLVYDKQETGIGYHLRKANYYVSDMPKPNFKRHPAFYDENGNEVDYILLSAYEGSIYDTSESVYLFHDEQVADFKEGTGDKLCSIAGVKPASGRTQNLTIVNAEILSKNRGTGWHCDTIKSVSANQMLMMIEMGMLNMQTAIGKGVSEIPKDNSSNLAVFTGSTASLGNSTGEAVSSSNESNGVQTTYTMSGKVSVTYRGMENPYGNIFKYIKGFNMFDFKPYICTDFQFSEEKITDNYANAEFSVVNGHNYISAFGYSQKYDWLFLTSEVSGNSNLPVGDDSWISNQYSNICIARFGGHFGAGTGAGMFYWFCIDNHYAHSKDVGARLFYVPTAKI